MTFGKMLIFLFTLGLSSCPQAVWEYLFLNENQCKKLPLFILGKVNHFLDDFTRYSDFKFPPPPKVFER